MKSYQQFFAELKRRKVFRVMAVYGATAFVVLQVADLLAEGMGLPDQVLRITTFLVLIGFPIAIVLAWAFETTPDGVQRTEDATDEEISAIIAQPASRRWSAGLLALAGAALLFGGWWVGRTGTPERDLSQAVSAEATGTQSIAVLPFENVGGDEENLVLATGLHAEIETELVRVEDLTVVSVQHFNAATTPERELARELRVDHLLRGKVRRSGDQVRVNVYLVDVATSQNLWTYDFEHEVTPADLFATQKEIARNVARSLHAELSPESLVRLAAGPATDNMDALHLYYRSLARDQQELSRLEYLERAVELDPEFVEAWSALAGLRSDLVRVGEVDTVSALEAVQRTEALAPSTLEALRARGYYARLIEKDFESALSTLLAAAELAPSDPVTHVDIGLLQLLVGDFDSGLRSLKRAAALDPQNVEVLNWLAWALRGMARWEAADQVVERMLALDPSFSSARMWKIDLALALHGDPNQARTLAGELGLDPTITNEGWALTWVAIYDRDWEAARDALEDWPAQELGMMRAFRLTLLGTASEGLTGTRGAYTDSLLALYESDPLAEALKPFVANTLISSGREEEGLALLEEAAEESLEPSNGSWGSLWVEAGSFIEHGFPERGLEILEEAVGKPTFGWSFIGSVAFLEHWHSYDRVRDDPRFETIVERQKAYEAQAARDAEAEGPWP